MSASGGALSHTRQRSRAKLCTSTLAPVHSALCNTARSHARAGIVGSHEASSSARSDE